MNCLETMQSSLIQTRCSGTVSHPDGFLTFETLHSVAPLTVLMAEYLTHRTIPAPATNIGHLSEAIASRLECG